MGFSQTFIATMPFLMVLFIVAIVFTFRFLVARQRHKEVMAALEKGLSPCELKVLRGDAEGGKGSVWIRQVSFGVLLLIGSAGLFVLAFLKIIDDWQEVMVASLIAFALGVAEIVAGLLNRKAEQEAKQDALRNSQSQPPQS